jgi:Kdo-III transferase WaaZ
MLSIKPQSFEQSRGRYSGTVVILASGPSAKGFPLAACPFPVIAVNGSVHSFDGLAVRPFYYLCDDVNFARGRPELLAMGIASSEHVALSDLCFLEAEKRGIALPEDKPYFLLERVNRMRGQVPLGDRRFAWSIRDDRELHSDFSLWRRKPNRIGFSCNFSKGYFCARTIAYVGVQLAFHLGFSKVLLVGVDLDPAAGRSYQEEKALPSTLDDDFEDYILPSFRFMRQRIIQPGRFEVFNLSPCSRLPEQLTPRVAWNQIFDEPV